MDKEHPSNELPSVIDIGEQDMAPKNHIYELEKDMKHGVGSSDAIRKFDYASEPTEEDGPHVIKD
jgi:hypothetical protein